jgi:hypothetical protein
MSKRRVAMSSDAKTALEREDDFMVPVSFLEE